MILPPLGVFLILTSAYPSSKGIGAVFFSKNFIKQQPYMVENNGNKVTLFVCTFFKAASYVALKVVLLNNSLLLYQNYSKVTLLTSAGSSN